MLAISLTQPFATLIALGAKRIETRSWKTSYRGELAIHAAKGFPPDARAICKREPFKSVLLDAGLHVIWGKWRTTGVEGEQSDFPLGMVVAVCRLTGCVPTGDVMRIHTQHVPGLTLNEHELEFGDFSPGRYAWFLEDVRPLEEPVPARGALGLWKWEPPANMEELYA